MYIVIGRYRSKYGFIVYAAKLRDDCPPEAQTLDMNNVYIHTLYFKGSSDIVVGDLYQFQTVKGENGLTYAFL